MKSSHHHRRDRFSGRLQSLSFQETKVGPACCRLVSDKIRPDWPVVPRNLNLRLGAGPLSSVNRPLRMEAVVLEGSCVAQRFFPASTRGVVRTRDRRCWILRVRSNFGQAAVRLIHPDDVSCSRITFFSSLPCFTLRCRVRAMPFHARRCRRFNQFRALRRRGSSEGINPRPRVLFQVLSTARLALR